MIGFHEGERAVQRRAGVSNQADRLVGMLAPADLSGGVGRFLVERTLAILTARNVDGRLWISPMPGPTGFLDGRDTTLRIHATLAPSDPLAKAPADQPVGLLAIDFPTRRRVRINGNLMSVDDRGLVVAVEQAFGNCPQYIQQRHVGGRAMTADEKSVDRRVTDALDEDQAALIRRADTFFLGTIHPDRGADASHRGGTPGFVRVSGTDLWWPDYPGNNMFNSFGNLAVDDTAALLFVDFATGITVQLSGTATVEWTTPGSDGDDGGTGRRVRFTPRQVVQGNVAALGSLDLTPYPRNPALT